MKNLKQQCLLLGLGFLLVPGLGKAISLADTPLFLTAPVTPNIVMTLDDSGSMAWGYVPDGISGTSGTRRYASSDFNALYYNPAVKYDIPTRKDGVTYTTSWAAARRNGFDSGRGTVDLSNNYRVTVVYYNDLAGDSSNYDGPGIGASRAAYYYRYLPGSTGCSPVNKTNDNCYSLVRVGTASDVTAGTNAQKQQNFANWYSFYRTRALSTISAAMSAAGQIGDSEARLAWQSINCTIYTCCNSLTTGTCSGYAGGGVDNRIRDLTPAHRTTFYNFLQRFSSEGGTPLRSAMVRAGSFYQTTAGLNNPYLEHPQVDTLGEVLACRKNFHIMMTDGIWNTDADATIGLGNQDNSAHTFPDGTGYTARAPYSDANSNSLADIAFFYWRNDLNTSLDNKVPAYIPAPDDADAVAEYWNAKNNPANWQNMVNFTVGLGLTGTMSDPIWGGDTYSGDFAALNAGTKNWPATGTSVSPGNVYDLWHAAINSRGQFFSVEEPASMTTAFRTILNSINANVSAAAGLSSNSTSIITDSLVFQARFDPKKWGGELLAYPVTSSGLSASIWDAGKLMSSRSLSKVFTWNIGSGGVVFDWANLTPAQQLLLNTNMLGTADAKGSDRVNWIRGDVSKEVRNGGTFRNRPNTVLGDIVNSDLAYTRNEDFGYSLASFGGTVAEKAAYATFLTAKSSRLAMVYAGANDGMLHGFRGDTSSDGGKELLAYIPNAVYDKLSGLTDPGYAHKYFVDGPPGIGDAYYAGSWKTILASGLGNGGKAIFAIDISNPAAFSASNVLWEKSSSDTGFGNLGYIKGRPRIAKLNSGEWAVIINNGYNSSTGAASLYLLNVATGDKIAEVVVDAGGPGVDNGLSEPALIDTNGDRIVDFAYAGDLKGNLWKINLTTMTADYKLYAAGSAQPITSAPIWGASPDSGAGGVMVYFGTGKYLGMTDVSDTSVQTVYGIWDKGAGVSGRTDLQEQKIVSEEGKTVDGKSFTLRETTDNDVDWAGGKLGWFMDLGHLAAGERVVVKPSLAFSWLVFVTVVPKDDRCAAGGDSWSFVLDPTTGKRPEIIAMDLNNDGSFDAEDALAGGTAPSAVKSDIGILSRPVFFSASTTSSSFDFFSEMTGGTGDAGGHGGSGTGVTSGSTGSTKTTGYADRGSTSVGPPTSGTPVNRIYWMQIQ
jgi:type IV pilus assembly protein PilY1